MNAFQLKPAPRFVDWSERLGVDGLSLQSGDLFDRVINLKFITSAKNADGVDIEDNEFVLRSDYEIVDDNFLKDVAENSLTLSTGRNASAIRRCRQKPSIKVQYKQVSGNTQLEMDILVQNFYMFDREGKTLMSFSNASGSLKAVEVQLGYFGQFADHFKLNLGGVPTLNQYFDFSARPADVQTITCNVGWAQMEKFPPDSTLHIHGWVGSSLNPPVTDKMYTVDTGDEGEGALGKLTGAFGSADGEVYTYEGDSDFKFNNFAHYLFDNITRRFFRSALPATTREELLKFRPKFKGDGACMDDSSALLYGVRVFLSEGVVGDGKSDAFLGKPVMYDQKGDPIPGRVSSVFICEMRGDTPMKALNAFISAHGHQMRAQPLPNGDYLMYLKSEQRNPSGLASMKWYSYDPRIGKMGVDLNGDAKVSPAEMGLVEFTYPDIYAFISNYLGGKSKNADPVAFKPLGMLFKRTDRLPAVYSMTLDRGLCTIVCPFYRFLVPFQKFYFASRYATGSIVDYFVGMADADLEFTAISMTVTFATVEEANEMQITCLAKESKK